MKVVIVTKNDIKTINFIVQNLVNGSGEGPSKEHLKSILADDRTYLLAATLEDEVIGYALAYKFPSLYSTGYLTYLYDIEVLTTYRRRGAGRLLVETLLNQLKSDGVSELWLGTATDNIEGQALFSATGATRSGETFNDFTYELK